MSAASAWEIGTQVRLGKLDGAQAVVHGYFDHLRRLRADELPVRGHHGLTAGTMAWDHRDPCDRVLAAQCMIESLPLCTADAARTAFPGLRVIF